MSPAPRLALAFALGVLGWSAWQAPRPPAPEFLLAAPDPAAAPGAAPARTSVPPPTSSIPGFQAELLPQAAASAHAASLAQLPDGTLLAAWFAGSREGATDVAIYLSRRAATPGAAWSPPEAIASRSGTARELRRHLRKLGNPVLHVAPDGRLQLYFVSVSLGGWAGSSINLKESRDGGRTWSPAVKLVTSPFFNISTLVRTPPLALADGGLGLPAYHEFVAKQGEWLHLGPDGRLLDKVRMPQERATLQPAAVPLDRHRALALLRDAGPGQGHVLAAASDDGGSTWAAAPALPLGNPNASVALLRLDDGQLLLANNPGPGRSRLELSLSPDQGQSWLPLGAVEAASEQDDKNAEFSYPSLLQARDGSIHLAYTWRRQGIRHLSFNRAWLEARLKAPELPLLEGRP